MMPKMHVAFADSYEPSGPFGAKGLGEIGLDAIPAAIANAIADAVGVRITELPITSEKIYRALHPQAFANEQVAPPAAPKGGMWARLSAGKPSGARPFNPEFVIAQERGRGRRAARRRRHRAGLGRHVARDTPRAHRLPAGEAPGRDDAHSRTQRNVHRRTRRAAHRLGRARSRRIYDDARVCRGWQAISDALEAVGHVRLRRMITVGGSIGPLIGGFDLPVALLALNARVTVAGPKGRRTVSLEEAFKTRFAKDEMVVSVEVDPLPARSGSAFYKYMARGVLEIPTVNTAAAVTSRRRRHLQPGARGRGLGQLEADHARSAATRRQAPRTRRCCARPCRACARWPSRCRTCAARSHTSARWRWSSRRGC